MPFRRIGDVFEFEEGTPTYLDEAAEGILKPVRGITVCDKEYNFRYSGEEHESLIEGVDVKEVPFNQSLLIRVDLNEDKSSDLEEMLKAAEELAIAAQCEAYSFKTIGGAPSQLLGRDKETVYYEIAPRLFRKVRLLGRVRAKE
jgi:hypothetical protein